MVDVENRRKAILVLKSRVPPVVQMFALAQDWFMVFPALVPLVIFTAEHVYSGNPGDRFSAQGVISHNKRVIYNWYKAVWVYNKHGVYSKQYSLAKRADKISYHLVFIDVRWLFLIKVHGFDLDCFVPSSVYMTHPAPLPACSECRVYLGWCSACDLYRTSHSTQNLVFIWFASTIHLMKQGKRCRSQDNKSRGVAVTIDNSW